MRRALGSLALVLSLTLPSVAEGRVQGHGHGQNHGQNQSHTKGKKQTVSGRGERGRSSKRAARRKKPPAPPPMPSRLEVQSIEPKSGSVRVGLIMSGPTHPPEPRLFVLTDDRGRRFVPATADCTTSDVLPETSAASVPVENLAQPIHWQCELTIAPLYRRAALTGVSMEWGERVVSAVPGQVRARWAEGPTSRPVPPPTRSTSASEAAPAPPSEPEPPVAGSGEDDEEAEPE